jgi:hypothetical protein
MAGGLRGTPADGAVSKLGAILGDSWRFSNCSLCAGILTAVRDFEEMERSGFEPLIGNLPTENQRHTAFLRD